MKKLVFTVACMALSSMICISAQNTSDEFGTRYGNLVDRVGYAGVGVETMLDRWEKAFPDDPEMLMGKFNFFLSKSVTTELKVKAQDKYLGQKPTLSLKDSTGADVNYFEEIFFDDSLFVLSSQAIDKAIKLYPDRLDLRFNKITALLSYEKESPDMTTTALNGLIDYHCSSHPEWKWGDGAAEENLFESGIQEFCASMYAIGTPVSYESFRSLSERMLKYQPSNTMFLTNLGTYNFVVKNDNKTAMKYYAKVLKLEPDNYTAIKNSVLMARRAKNVKQEKKYLPLLAKYGADDLEKAAAQARLDALDNKK